MREFVNLFIRLCGGIAAIQGLNMILKYLGIAIYVGINGYTIVLSAILGLPGILGLYVVGYLL